VSAVIAWMFRSGPRLVLVLVGLVAVLLLGGWLLSGHGPSGGRTGAGTSTTSSAVGLPEVGPATDVAVRFATLWAAKPANQTKTQWLEGLRPLATQQLAAGLAYTDPANLPGGKPNGTPTVRFVSTASTLIAVPLSGGGPVLVTVVQDGGQWRVADIQPAVGD
jgi:hypothetical protein